MTEVRAQPLLALTLGSASEAAPTLDGRLGPTACSLDQD